MKAVIYKKGNAYLSGGGTRSLNTGSREKCGLCSEAEQAWALSAESHSGHLKRGEKACSSCLHTHVIRKLRASLHHWGMNTTNLFRAISVAHEILLLHNSCTVVICLLSYFMKLWGL